jgi:pimeloyl-ACP methyl ester carboxylesterase
MHEARGRCTTRGVLALALALPISVLLAAPSAGSARDVSNPSAANAQRPAAGLATLLRLRGRSLGKRAAADCGKTPGLVCSQVEVPLDRSGQTPGTVSLHVEMLPAAGVVRGVMFLIAGGPGQGSARAFGLGSPANAALYRFVFPGYTLVAYDDRGTGSSGVLQCPALQVSVSFDAQADLGAVCADMLGPQRVFYSTSDHAEDLDAVRQALGFDRVGLWGTSYGTKLAMAYGLAHPDHVERLLLDSVVPPELPDPFSAEVLSRMPATLTAFCADGSCRSATSDFAGDVAAVANMLAAKPVKGKVLQPNGTTKSERVSGLDLLAMVVDADLSPGLAAELPAVVRAARLGDVQPLLRIRAFDARNSIMPPEDLSAGLFAATVCRDGPFPWQPDTPIAGRQALLNAAVAALPAGALGPFGSWAIGLGNAQLCLKWPTPAGGAPLGPGPLPDVPVLALSGGFDMRTPTAGALSVISRFPQGRVLVVPGVGHSVLGADPSFCAVRAVRSWMQGGAVPDQCARPKPLVAPIAGFPSGPSGTAGPRRTLAISESTVREAEAAWLMTLGGPGATLAGIYGGKLVVTAPRAFRLVRYSIAPGVALSGKLRITKFGPPITFQGALTVTGASAASGVLGLSGGRLGGTLGGRIVRS